MTNKMIDEQIKAELKRTGGNVSKVARSLGLPYHILVQRYGPRAANILPTPAPEPRNIREFGKPGFETFVIAIKRCGSEWPDDYREVIIDARQKFDAGTHEMFQSSHQGWVVQYLAPRVRKVEPRRFFASLVR